MFHLYALVFLDNGIALRVEKNQTINIYEVDAKATEQDMETDRIEFKDETSKDGFSILSFMDKDTSYNIPDVTFGQLMHKMYEVFPSATGLQYSDYYLYSGKNNNCQKYIWTFINSTGNGHRNELRDFIMQNTEALIGRLNSVAQMIVQGVTDIAAQIEYIKEGK